jgi:hypothetical protein
MEINRMIVSLAAGLLLLSFEGCSDAPREQGADLKPAEKPSEVRSPLEDVKTELQALPRNVTDDRYPERAYYEGLRSRVSMLSPAERTEAFHVAENALLAPKLKEYPLARRSTSLEVYLTIVRGVAFAFWDQLDDQEAAWNFLLQTLDILDREYKIVSSPSFDPRNPPMGLRTIKPEYLAGLDEKRFYAIRKGFENESSYFPRYYWNLSEEQRKKWKEKIERVARRKVVISNPFDSSKSEPLPRRQFNPPTYLPEKIREKYKEDRRKLLKKAGIDPKEEGL